MNVKKELKQKYKDMKTPMGVFIIKNSENNKAFVDISLDTKSILNRHKFQLKMNMHMVKELQNDWNKYGEDKFTFEVLESLSYEESEEKIDYNEELEIIKMIWIEKLTKEGNTILY